MTIPKLIGITGLAGTGKDTLADHLSKTFGHEKYAFATPIKELLNARFGWMMEMWDDRSWKESDQPEAGRREDWEEYNHFSPRSWAQWLGTDVGRVIGGEDVWVKRMVSRWYGVHGSRRPSAMIIPDVRFDNEADTIRGMGGVVVKLLRPCAVPVNAHVSEKGVRSEFIDATITNDRCVDDFLSDAISVLSTLKGES